MTKTRFTAKQLENKLNSINSSLGLESGDIGSIELSIYGGQGVRVEMITCASRSITPLTLRDTARKAWEEFCQFKTSHIESMRAKRKTYRGNTKHVMKRVESHLMAMTDTDTIELARAEFMNDFNAWDCDYYRKSFPNLQELFSEYLMASNFTEVYFYDMRAFLDTLSLTNPKQEPSDEKVAALYRHLLFKAIKPFSK